MNVSRNFLLLGVVFLIFGILLGMYMGGSQDFSFGPSHAHINLVGFVLSAIFALVYKAYPSMTEGGLARAHFWLHAVGAAGMNLVLFLWFAGRISESQISIMAPITETMIAVGILIFGWLVYRRVS